MPRRMGPGQVQKRREFPCDTICDNEKVLHLAAPVAAGRGGSTQRSLMPGGSNFAHAVKGVMAIGPAGKIATPERLRGTWR